jgi:hypothetical protein
MSLSRLEGVEEEQTKGAGGLEEDPKDDSQSLFKHPRGGAAGREEETEIRREHCKA